MANDEVKWGCHTYDGELTLCRPVVGRLELVAHGSMVEIAWEDSGCFRVAEQIPLELLEEFVRRALPAPKHVEVTREQVEEAGAEWPDRHPYTGERFVSCQRGEMKTWGPPIEDVELEFATKSGSTATGHWLGEWQWSSVQYKVGPAPGTRDGWLNDPSRRGKAVD